MIFCVSAVLKDIRSRSTLLEVSSGKRDSGSIQEVAFGVAFSRASATDASASVKENGR
jgi:hypothetical protein